MQAWIATAFGLAMTNDFMSQNGPVHAEERSDATIHRGEPTAWMATLRSQ